MDSAPPADRYKGRPRRALFASAAALGGVTLLAGSLTSTRQEISLAPRQSPAGWPVSFQPPTGWELKKKTKDHFEYQEARDPDNPRVAVFRLTPKPADLTATDLAARVMGMHFDALQLLQGLGSIKLGGFAAEEAALGPLQGARVNMPETGDYVHVGLPAAKEVPAVVVEYHTAGPFSPRDKRLCAMIAEAVAAPAP